MKDSKLDERERDIKIVKASKTTAISVWEHGGSGREVSRGNR